MNINKIIGVALLLLATGIIFYSLSLKKHTNEAFENAKNKVLLIVNGKDVGKVDTFQISYVHSLGLRVVNTEPVLKKDADSANIEFYT